MIGEIISTIGSGIQQARQNKFNKETVEQQNRFNTQMSNLQWSRDQEMWQKMNEYNTPAQQMNRFKEAGLNPNLIYGQGNPGNTGSIPHYQAPQLQAWNKKALDAHNAISHFQDYRLREQQINNVKALTDVKVQEAQNKALQQSLQNILIKKGLMDLKWYEPTQGQKYINLVNQNLMDVERAKNLKKQGVIMDYSADYRKKQLDAFDKITKMQLDLTDSMIKKNLATTNIDQVRKDIMTKELDWFEINQVGKYLPSLTGIVRTLAPSVFKKIPGLKFK